MRKIFIIAISCTILFSSVANASDMQRLAMELTRINSRIEAKLMSLGPAEYDNILQIIIAENPNPIVRAYPIFGVHSNNTSFLLACSPDRSQGLLVDASCTANFDFHLWQQGFLPCQFPAEIQNVCR